MFIVGVFFNNGQEIRFRADVIEQKVIDNISYITLIKGDDMVAQFNTSNIAGWAMEKDKRRD